MEAIYENNNFISVCDFIPNHLYFVTVQNINNGGSCEAIIPHTDDFHFFTTDNELVYHNFYGDFGPLSITCLYKFCKKLMNKLATYAGDAFYEKFTISRFGRKDLTEKLREKFVKKKIVIYYTSTNNEKRANAAFLISAFAVLYLGYSPRLAHKKLQPNKMRYRSFQDASIGLSPYKITMKNCLDALHKASVFGFFNFNDFNAAECSYYENIEHGDLNWIIPQKFVAFRGPVEEKIDFYHHPYFYIEYFLCNNVTDVIRLNQRAYDSKCFTIFGIKHHDLYMQDGTDPPESILKSFMHVVDSARGAVAVHCKAGLGRTGSLIGAYLLKHYRMTAKEAIAWVRICRPGSVIGHQQTWLENHEESLWYEGNEWRFKMYGKTELVPFLPCGIYSYLTPRKEFPGLRELLNNLTKRSRYRFIVKNRPRKSKTKLQHMIRNLLEKGRVGTQMKKASESEKSIPFPQPDRNDSLASDASEVIKPLKNDPKSLQYLKPPPQQNEVLNPNDIPNEYSYHDYQKQPKDRIGNEYEPVQNLQKVMNYQGVYPPQNAIDGNVHAMYANPNVYYSTVMENGFPQYTNPQKLYTPVSNPSEVMPKAYSEETPPPGRMKTPLLSKSIDKNWKQNSLGLRYEPPNLPNRKYKAKRQTEDVCAFDTRLDTISQYSRFNKPFLNKPYQDEDQLNGPADEYYDDKKSRGSERSGRHHGFLLSPEDLQSWVETFDEKVDDAQSDNRYAHKRFSVT